MSYTAEWNGHKYELDPTEYTQLELRELKKRTGLTFIGIVEGINVLDPDVIQALFWINDWRTDQSITLADYQGPTMRHVLPHIEGLGREVNSSIPSPGKGATSATSGSEPSPSGTASRQPSSTG